ncbi:MAG: hypothetical protein V7K69_08765 [Nostoc sp.]|uniref:hypothetical protein n=1 Tax=Nostoc sp. TaxID=1180 RepID=UPI002FFC1CF0
MSDLKSDNLKERTDDIKKKEQDRLYRDIDSLKVNQHLYPSESEYVQAIKECRNAYDETIKAITEIEKEAEKNQAYLSTRESIEIFLMLLELGLKAPSASFRSWYAKKVIQNFTRPTSRPLMQLQGPQVVQPQPVDELANKLRDIIRNTEALNLKQLSNVTVLAENLGAGFETLNEAQKIEQLTKQLEKQRITGSWKGYVVPEWLDKSLLIAAISVALWETVETPEQERVVKIAKEAVILSTAYVTVKASERLLIMATAIAPESEGGSMVVYVGLYIVLTIVATLVGEGVGELFDSIFGSNTPPALTKDLTKSLSKDLVKDLSKKLQKELHKSL